MRTQKETDLEDRVAELEKQLPTSCTNPSQGSHGAGYYTRKDSIGELHPYCRKCDEELEL